MNHPRARSRRQGRCCFGVFLLIFAVFGASACARSESEVAAPTAPLPAHYVPAAAALAEFGLRPESVLDAEGRRTFANAWHTVALQHDKREIHWDGRRLFLGEPVVANDGQLWLSPRDIDTSLRPLLRPPTETVPELRTIWVDAGHGGRDRGAHSDAIGLSEKDAALNVALMLGDILSAQGYEVRHTRTEDVFVELGERARLSRQADLLVSIHFNAAVNPEANGTEVYALTPAGHPSTNDVGAAGMESFPTERGNRTDPWNVLLADELHASLLERLGTTDRGIKRARFAVLRLTDVPAVLVEPGFLSHESEARELAQPERQAEIAEALAAGIVRYHNHLLSLVPVAP